MADIQIDKPINLLIDILEFDENLQSLKLQFVLKNDESIKGKFDINFNFWVFCKDFDLFADGLTDQFVDLLGITRIDFQNDTIALIPSFNNQNLNFKCRIEINSDRELKENLKRKFKSFPKWW